MAWKDNNNKMFTFGNRKNDCYECPDRHVGCHSECEKYKNFQKQLEKDRNDYFERRKKETYVKPKARR